MLAEPHGSSCERAQAERARAAVGARAKGREEREAEAGGYLGITTFPVRLPGGVAEKYGTRGGLITLSVDPGSPAEQAGLMLGDTLLTLDDEPMLDVDRLVAHLPPERVGQQVRAKVLRAGSAMDVTLTAGSRP